MNVLELLVGRLALDRQLISEPLLQHCLQQGGQALGDVLVAQGFPHDTIQALFAEAQQAQMLCTGCAARYGVPHLIPHDPWACRACGQELILLGNEDSRRLGTGRWNPSGSEFPTSTGSRRVGPANTPGVDTRPGSGRWAMGTPPTHQGGVAPTGSGSGSWRGSGSGFSASQRFRSKLQPGTILDGHEILDELGRGGMGIVFKARNLARGDLVALKVLLAGAMATERQQQRFKREAEALAKLNHPNIVQVFDMGDLGDHMYFTMEFVDGQPLGDQMKTNRVSLRRAVEIARDVAHGLQHAHENEIVHRDIKPDNILIDQSGTPLITDFGLVRDASNEEARLTRSGAVLGTPYYMSPEQASGKGHHLDGSADVYSLGTVLFQMLTGELPFDGQTQIELTKKIMELAPPRPSKTNAAVPVDLDAIVLKTLAKTPELRYPTAKDFADDLDRFLRGEPVVARPPGRVSAKLMVTILSVLIAVGLLGLGGALAIKAWNNRPPPPPPPGPPVDPGLAEAREAAVAKVEELWRDADRVPIGVYRATLWKLVEATGEALKVAPESGLLHFRRALVHDRLQKYDEARVGYAKVGQLDPQGELGARAVFHAARLVGRVDDDDVKAGALIEDWEKGAGTLTDPPQGPWRLVVRALRLYCADKQNSDEALRLVETAEGLAKVELGEIQTFKSKLLFARGDMQDAFDVLQQAIRLDPKDATNWAARASFYAAVREDIEQGLKDVERALILDPENLTALELRGSMRVMGKEPERGKRDLERVLQRRPASDNALRNMVLLNVEREPERAIELMRRAEAAAPTKTIVYLLQADVLIDMDRLKEALEALGRGIERLWSDRANRRRLMLRYEELAIGAQRTEIMRAFAAELDARHRGNGFSKILRGHAELFETRDPTAAYKFWEGCQKADKDAIFVWERRLRILHTVNGEDSEEVRREVDRFIAASRQVKSSQGLAYAARYAAVVRKDEALARRLAIAATEADSFDTHAWITRGFVDLVGDRHDAGFRHIQRALALAPESSEANYLMGRALLGKGKLDGAIRSFMRSVILNPFSSEQIAVMCALLLRAKRPKAVMNITGRNGRRLQALKLSPTPTLVLHRARALVGLGKPERSMGLLDELLKANLRSPKSRRYLGQVLAEAGRLEDARRVLEALVKEVPGDRGAQELLQKVLQGIQKGKQ